MMFLVWRWTLVTGLCSYMVVERYVEAVVHQREPTVETSKDNRN
jgi:hypothetical protein